MSRGGSSFIITKHVSSIPSFFQSALLLLFLPILLTLKKVVFLYFTENKIVRYALLLNLFHCLFLLTDHVQ